MTNEPKSLGRYIAVATLVVIPAFLAFSSHVETKVAPVASYVAQVYGVQAPTQMVAGIESPVQR
ncbi:MAG: hypothetical protein ACREBN_11470 [Burkholderiaceae bacterium]